MAKMKTELEKKSEQTMELAIAQQKLPGSLGEAMAFATLLARSGVVPASYAGKPEAVFAIIQMGKDLGIKPMLALQNMSFINGTPSMRTDLLCALAHKCPDWAGYEVLKITPTECLLVVRRKNKVTGGIDEFPGVFTKEEAIAAGLWDKNTWKSWPRRMLKHRALSFALRDAFPDMFSGVYTDEEMAPNDYAAEEIRLASSEDDCFGTLLEADGVIPEAVRPKVATPKAAAPAPKKAYTPAPVLSSPKATQNRVAPTRIVNGKKI